LAELYSSWQKPWLNKLSEDARQVNWPMFRLLVQKALHFATTAAEDALEISGLSSSVSPFRSLIPVDVGPIRDPECASPRRPWPFSLTDWPSSARSVFLRWMEQELLREFALQERRDIAAQGVSFRVNPLLEAIVPILFRVAGEMAVESPTTKRLVSQDRLVESNEDLLEMLGNAQKELEGLSEEVDHIFVNGHANGYSTTRKRADRPDEDDRDLWHSDPFTMYAHTPPSAGVSR
jgi:hypothetical protein